MGLDGINTMADLTDGINSIKAYCHVGAESFRKYIVRRQTVFVNSDIQEPRSVLDVVKWLEYTSKSIFMKCTEPV